MENQKNQNSSNLFVIIMFIVIIVLVLLFPMIYNFIEKQKLPEVPQEEHKPNEEEKVVTDEILQDIHYPIMRNSIYEPNTYYSLNKFTISNMSNEDILYNAFMGIEEVTLKESNTYSRCSNTPRQFDAEFIGLRIKNILGKNINYTLDTFYVPEDSNSNYPGTWDYDSYNSRFTYQGLCSSKESNTTYYDLEEFIKAEYQDKDIIVYYYVGFAKVIDNNYYIYSDAYMTNEINSGEFINLDELNTIFKSLGNQNKKIYKYTFKNTLCSYNEYCLYQGEYINEL